MDNKIRKISTVMLFALSCFAFEGAEALDYRYNSDKTALSTEDINLGVNVSAFEQDDSNIKIVITFTKSKKTIVSQIDYLNKNLKIDSFLKDNGPAAVTKGDIILIKMLGKKFHEDEIANPKLADALSNLLGFLSEAPPNIVIKINTSKAGSVQKQDLLNSDISALAIDSLCDEEGKSVTASYTVRRKPLRETVEVGPCYDEANECLGRCGPGCDAPPATRVQRFTQDCLDHDVCTQNTGQIFGVCTDEWIAAADDFFFAPDCGNMTGQWTEESGNNLLWDITEDSFTGLITGSADNSCTLDVTGAHTGADSTLNAINAECSAEFTYTGTASTCNTINGSWQSPTDSGPYTLTREK